MTNSDDHNLISGFVQALERYPSRPALCINGEQLTYRELGQAASNIAATILEHDRERNALAALFAHRSVTAYAGILGILAAGRGYVPLNPKFPIERTRRMLLRSESDVVVVGEESFPQVEALLADLPRPLTVILPEVSALGALAWQFPRHRFIPSSELPSGPAVPAVRSVSSESVAYLLFTSGSTGVPKGVPVRHSNVKPYIEFVSARYGVKPDDRVSQIFDLTFDLSVHDMFMCWSGGACLCCVPQAAVMAPAKFIRDQQLTLWFSIPSVVTFMSRLRLLRPGCFPTLRFSLFCGEALPEASARSWQEAAPNSVIENLYGPTEATIAITYFRWNHSTSPSKCQNGIVPIGWPFDGQDACIVDTGGRVVPRGQSGELCLSGSQVTSAYWKSPEETRERYVRLPGQGNTIWYRTGDRAEEGEDGCLSYLGRLDNQVKIRGHRAELQEIDFVLRRAAGTEQAVSVAWPVQNGSAEGVVAFVCGSLDRDGARIRAHCKRALPDVMVPRTIYFLDEMPQNSNGKVDRQKLISLLEHSTQ